MDIVLITTSLLAAVFGKLFIHHWYACEPLCQEKNDKEDFEEAGWMMWTIGLVFGLIIGITITFAVMSDPVETLDPVETVAEMIPYE